MSQIPAEGMEIDTTFEDREVHVEGEESFSLQPGGALCCRLDSGDAGSIHVRGDLAAGLLLECGRCLERFPFSLEQQLDLIYLPHQAGQEDEEEDEVELSDHDVVVAYYKGDRLDLGEMVREQLFLSLPMKRLCREDCRGLCPSCGADRNRAPCGCPPESPDPRLAPLREIFDKGPS